MGARGVAWQQMSQNLWLQMWVKVMDLVVGV